MVCVPVAEGGEYKPSAEIVPIPAEPPGTPSTVQMTLPPLPPITLNGCRKIGVSTETRGTIEKPTPVPVRDTVWGVPAALSSILIEALRTPTIPGVKLAVIVQFV